MLSFVRSIEGIQILAAIVGLVLLLAWESAKPFFTLFRATSRERGVHLVRNLTLAGLNSFVIAVVFVGLWLKSSTWAEDHGIGILNVMESRFQLAGWIRTLLAVLLLDAWTYIWHRLNHRITFLWRFHQVHHADRQMDVTTAGRFHIGEIALSSLLRVPLIILLGVRIWELLIYETLMFAVVQFHHANVALPARMDRFLRLFIVTPAMHKIHHSDWRPETDSNYSSFLSIWDRLGRSYRMRERLEGIRFGLGSRDEEGSETLQRMITMPLKIQRQEDRAESGEAVRLRRSSASHS